MEEKIVGMFENIAFQLDENELTFDEYQKERIEELMFCIKMSLERIIEEE